MKTAHVIRDMQQAHRNAEQAFRQNDYKGSVECYKKAIELCNSLPADVGFDRGRFEASCQAGLSGAYGRLGKHMESFAAANMALAYYDKGEVNPADVGRWLMAQVNQGTALAALRCLPAALEALAKAKEIFHSKALDHVQNRQWMEMVEGNIAAIKAQIEKTQT
jgi:tetratricopeptide (TPR) repeat protein